MKKGYIKLHRKTLESDVFSDPALWHLFSGCLLMASHKHYDHLLGKKTVHVTPGQFITGRFALNKRLFPDGNGPSELTVWRWLKRLAEQDYVHLDVNTSYTVVTVVNWERYQCDALGGEHNGDEQENEQVDEHLEHKQEALLRDMHEEKGILVCVQGVHGAEPGAPEGQARSVSTAESELEPQIDYHENTLSFWRVCCQMAKLPKWFKRDIDLAFRCGVTLDSARSYIYRPENRKLLGNSRLLAQKLIEHHEQAQSDDDRPETDWSQWR